MVMCLVICVMAVFAMAANAAEVEYTAPDGTVTETTLVDAVGLVNTNEGGTIKLLQDVTTTTALKPTVGCTINLNTHTLTSSGNPAFTPFNGKNLEATSGALTYTRDDQHIFRIENGTLNTSTYAIRMRNGYLQMEGVTMTTTTNGIDIYNLAEPTDTRSSYIKDCSILFGSGYTIRTTGSGLTANITIEDSSLGVNAAKALITAPSGKSGIVLTVLGESKFYSTSSTIFSGVSFAASSWPLTDAEGGQIFTHNGTEYSGMYCQSAYELVVESYAASYTTPGGVTTNYATLPLALEAAAAANGGGTVTLLDNIEVNGTIQVNCGVTIDFADFTLTSSANPAFQVMSPDNATVKAIFANGTDAQKTFVLKGGKLNVTAATAVKITRGFLQIDDMEITSTGDNILISSMDTGRIGQNYVKDSILVTTGSTQNIEVSGVAAYKVDPGSVLLENSTFVSKGSATFFSNKGTAAAATPTKLILSGTNYFYAGTRTGATGYTNANFLPVDDSQVTSNYTEAPYTIGGAEMTLHLWTTSPAREDVATYQGQADGPVIYLNSLDGIGGMVDAGRGGIITLLNDGTVTATQETSYGYTVKLNGYTLTSTALVAFKSFDDFSLVTDPTAELTGYTDAQKIVRFENGTVVAKENAGGNTYFLQVRNGYVQLEGVNVYSDDYGVDLIVAAPALTCESYIKDSVVVANTGRAVWSRATADSLQDDILTVEDSTLVSLQAYTVYNKAGRLTMNLVGETTLYAGGEGLLEGVDAPLSLVDMGVGTFEGCTLCPEQGTHDHENLKMATTAKFVYVTAGGVKTSYDTFAAALAAANADMSGGTLYTFNNVDATESIVISAGMTIDLSGCTLTSSANPAIITLPQGDATVVANYDSWTQAQKTVILKNGTVKATAGDMIRVENGYLQLEDFTGYATSGVTVRLYSLEKAANGENYILGSYLVSKNQTVLVEAGFLDAEGTTRYADPGSLKVEGSTLVSTASASFMSNKGKGTAAVKVTLILEGNNSLYNLSSRTDYKNTNFVAAATNNVSGKETATFTDAVAGIDNVTMALWKSMADAATYQATEEDEPEYITLSQIARYVSANKGGIVILKKDQTADISLVLNAACTLDLGGFTLTSTADVAVVGNPGSEGTLVVKNGSIAMASGDAIVLNSGYLDVDDVTLLNKNGENIVIKSTDKAQDNSITNSTLIAYNASSLSNSKKNRNVEYQGGAEQIGLNTNVSGCTLISANTNNFGADRTSGAAFTKNVFTLSGDNTVYVGPLDYWFHDTNPTSLGLVNVNLMSAYELVSENASVSGKVGSLSYSYSKLKHYELTAAVETEYSTEDLNTLHAIIRDTAYAYYYKSQDGYRFYKADYLLDYIQGHDRGKVAANAISPEDAAPDNYFYTVCTQFHYAVYDQLFKDYHLLGSSRNVYVTRMTAMSEDHPMVVAKYSASDYADADAAADGLYAFVYEWSERFGELQAGDLICLADNDTDGMGHGLLYVGGDTIVDTGESVNTNVWDSMFNLDSEDPSDWHLYYFSGGDNMVDEITILRPLNDPTLLKLYAEGGLDGMLTDQAKARIENPDLGLTLYGENLGGKDSVVAGEEYTLNLVIKNHGSTTLSSLPVVMQMNGETVYSQTVTSIARNGSVTRSITFTVPADAKLGDVITISGNVNGLPTRTMNFVVGGEAVATQPITAAGDLSAAVFQTAFVNQFYQEVWGVSLSLPETVAGIREELFAVYAEDSDSTASKNELTLVPNKNSELYDMIVPGYLMGSQVALDDPAVITVIHVADRAATIYEADLQIGDIIVGETYADASPYVYIYAGNGKFVQKSSGTAYVLRDFADVAAIVQYANQSTFSGDIPAHESQWAVILRPTKTVEEISNPSVTFQPVLKLESELTMQLDLSMNNIVMAGQTEAGILLTDVDGEEKDIKLVWNSETKRYEAYALGVSAKDIAKSFSVQAYYTLDGETVYTEALEDVSIADIAAERLTADDATTEEKSMYLALLNYCTAAQDYLSDAHGISVDANENIDIVYDFDDNANEWYDLKDEIETMDWEVDSDMAANFVQSPLFLRRAGSLTLEGAINYNFLMGFDSSVMTNPENAVITAYYWTAEDYEAIAAAGEILTVDNATGVQEMEDGILFFQDGHTMYRAFVYTHKGHAAQDMYDPLYLTFNVQYEGETYNTGVIKYNPIRYVSLVMNENTLLGDLVKKMAIYGNAAKTYFETLAGV